LLENFKKSKSDLKIYSTAINHKLFEMLNAFKVQGDISAHTIDLFIKKERFR